MAVLWVEPDWVADDWVETLDQLRTISLSAGAVELTGLGAGCATFDSIDAGADTFTGIAVSGQG